MEKQLYIFLLLQQKDVTWKECSEHKEKIIEKILFVEVQKNERVKDQFSLIKNVPFFETILFESYFPWLKFNHFFERKKNFESFCEEREQKSKGFQ